MTRGKHVAIRGVSRGQRTIALLVAVGMLMALVIPAAANGTGDPNKVWLCHFDDNHTAVQPYTDDRNGSAPGFWTVSSPDPDQYLDGDYMVKWNDPALWPGLPPGLNSGQIALCTGNGGEFILVSVNALGSDLDVRGHRALNQGKMASYPDGWKG